MRWLVFIRTVSMKIQKGQTIPHIPKASHLIAEDSMTVELEVFNVLVDEAPSDEGHQIQKADGVEARVPSIDLLRLEHSLLALENSHAVLSSYHQV